MYLKSKENTSDENTEDESQSTQVNVLGMLAHGPAKTET